ncbi:MAG: hypothetical protein QM764_20200 [Chitinophagaceae bacterium]
MSKSLFDEYDIASPSIQLIAEIYEDIEKILPVSHKKSAPVNFKEFELFNYYEINHLGPVFIINETAVSFYLNFVEVAYSKNSGNIHTSKTCIDLQTWGMIYLKENYGHIVIKPESILDKIHDLINPIELDFKEDKIFSNKFYVITNNKGIAEARMNQAFRDCVQSLDVPEFLIEIKDNKLIVGNRKVLQHSDALGFVKFLEKISKQF